MALTLHGTVSDNTVALDRKTATPLIINGDMAIAQRGTSTTGLFYNKDNNFPSCDRWKFQHFGSIAYTAQFTGSQDTDVPTGQGFASSLKLACTTADATLEADTAVLWSYQFEGQTLQHLAYGTSSAKTMTFSFWVKSNITGVFNVELYQYDVNDAFSDEYTINTADTWEKKIITIPANTSNIITNDNTVGMSVRFNLALGSNYNGGTLPTGWQTRVLADTSPNMTNNIGGSTSNYINITGVQLEVGTFDVNSIPPFQFEDVGTSLARCLRYYQKIGNGTVAGQRFIATGKVRSSTQCDFGLVLPVEMRSSPTISVSDGTGFEVFHGGSAIANTTSLSYSNSSPQTVSGLFNVSSGLTTGNAAFIRTDSTAGRELQMDSEL